MATRLGKDRRGDEREGGKHREAIGAEERPGLRFRIDDARDRPIVSQDRHASFGLHAIDVVRDQDYGKMVALRGADIVRVPIADATAKLKTVSPALYEEAGVFFG